MKIYEIKNLVEKIQELEEKLDKKKEDDEISEFERTKRAVEEEVKLSRLSMKPKDFINFCSLSRTASSSFEHASLSTNSAAKAGRFLWMWNLLKINVILSLSS
jgi:hypothetical protein